MKEKALPFVAERIKKHKKFLKFSCIVQDFVL